MQSTTKSLTLKILVIRFSSIGDIVLTTPVLRCIKTQLDDAELHVLTKKFNAFMFLNNPCVDKVFEYDNNMDELIKILRKQHYDFVVDLHKNWRSIRVRLALDVRSASFPKLDFKKFLFTKLKIDLLPRQHVVDRYFKAVKRLGVTNDRLGLDYYIPEANELSFGDLPEEFEDGFVAVVIGGQHNTKLFPAEKVAEVCRLISLPVVLLGGPDDCERADRICNMVGKNIGNTCGKLNLDQSASLIKLSSAVLTNDTGLMHIAAAFHKPIVSIWGSTSPRFGMTPYIPGCECKSIIIENTGIKCHPCHKLGYGQCPKKHFACMNGICPETVADAIESFI